MAIDVITHGGGEGLSHTFNAIASLFNGKGSVGCTLIYISGSFASAMAIMTLVIKQELLPSIRWFVASLFLMNALMLPKIDIIIRDRMSGLIRPVAHVPFALGFFAGMASQMGDILAQQLDGIFAPASGEVMRYRRHGVAMASGLLSKAADFSVADPDAAQNLKAFVQNCMVFDVAKGKYTLKELLETPDVWGFLSTHASPIRGFPYRVGAKNTQIITCKKSMEEHEKQWRKHEKDAKSVYGPALYPGQNRAEAMSSLMSNLGLSYQYLTGLSADASLLLRQNMMRNIIREALLENNQVHDASAAVTAYATTRAQAQQRTAYQLQGSMASLALSTLKVVVEVLFYALFPIMVAVSLFPGGLVVIKKYLIALFWIQSWAPLYSILNMVVNLYGKSKSMAILQGGGLGISSIRPLTEANEWVSAVAGYTMMSVPFLSYGLIHYGAGALSQLSTHFGSIGQSAASHAAEEATTGNYNLGNTHFDNHNLSNSNAFKYDTNSLVAAGKQSVQTLEGALLQSTPDGKPLLDMTGSLPKLNSNLKMAKHLSSALHKSANESWQMGTQDLESAATNASAAFNQIHDYKEGRSKDTSDGTAYTEQQQSFQETASSRYHDLVEQFSRDHKVDYGVMIEAFGQVGIGVPLTKNEMGIRQSLKAGDSRLLQEIEQYSDKNGMSELLRQSCSEAKEGRLNFLDAEHLSDGKSVSALLGKTDSQLSSAQTHFAYAKGYQSQANFVEQNALQIDQDLSPQYWSGLVASEGLEGASQIVRDPVENLKHMQAFSAQAVNDLKQEFAGHATSPEAIHAQFLERQAKMRSEQDLDALHAEQNASIQARALEAGLGEPLDRGRQERVEEKLEHTRKELETEDYLLDLRKRTLARNVTGQTLGLIIPDTSGMKGPELRFIPPMAPLDLSTPPLSETTSQTPTESSKEET